MTVITMTIVTKGIGIKMKTLTFVLAAFISSEALAEQQVPVCVAAPVAPAPAPKPVVKRRKKKVAPVQPKVEYVYVYMHDSITESPIQVVNHYDRPHLRNRLFGIVGSGPAGLDVSGASPGFVAVKTSYGSLFGLGYQRNVYNNWNLGFMFLSNYTTGVTIGSDF